MSTQKVKVPDFGGAESVEVIELLVQVGDRIEKEHALLTLESEKAAMDVPSPYEGTVSAIHVKVGDQVTEGTDIVTLELGQDSDTEMADNASQAASKQEQSSSRDEQATDPSEEADLAKTSQAAAPKAEASVAEAVATSAEPQDTAPIYASPVVRRLAREQSIDLHQVTGSGPKGRIMKTDVEGVSHTASPPLAKGEGTGAGALPSPPQVDFSQFGEVSVEPLSRINKLSAKNMHRNWLVAPHVTQFDEADITEMEAFRKANKQQAEQQGFKFTPLVFIMKAVVAALKAYPRFNSSLSPDGETLTMKHYFHLGIAVDTPNGLVVPVIRDVDQKSLLVLAKELAELSLKARDGKLTAREMQGQCFTISSLGGIGGTAFTPIINLPDVAILGVSRAQMKPVYQGGEGFVPRLRLPLSLSYDHRVIDGALGARFSGYLVKCLSDVRQLLL